MTDLPLQLFALSESGALGARIATALGVPLGAHEEREFEDGEHKTRALENVRNRDLFVVQSLYGEPEKSVNDKLCRLLFFIGSLKDAGAARVTAVIPYLCYARKDRKTKARDPVTTRYLAQLLEAVGTDRVVVLDVHNPAAFQNAFRCPAEALDTARLFAIHCAPQLGADPVVVVSPDVGGVKRAERLREALSRHLGRAVGSAFMEKKRSAGVVSGEALVGEVEGAAIVIVDDLISTGGTLLRAAQACRRQGARAVHAVAAHGLFMGEAGRLLADPALDSLVVTDSIPPFRLDGTPARAKLTQIEIAPLLAEAIRRIHAGGSLVELLGE
ncbi:MAG: ribose-phosphate diphosphokinase [Porticoccaceae bacterium]